MPVGEQQRDAETQQQLDGGRGEGEGEGEGKAVRVLGVLDEEFPIIAKANEMTGCVPEGKAAQAESKRLNGRHQANQNDNQQRGGNCHHVKRKTRWPGLNRLHHVGPELSGRSSRSQGRRWGPKGWTRRISPEPGPSTSVSNGKLTSSCTQAPAAPCLHQLAPRQRSCCRQPRCSSRGRGYPPLAHSQH